MKQFLLLILISGCLNNQVSNDNETWRNYYLSNDSMKHGLVKIFEVKNPHESFIFYDEIFLDNDEIHLKRYDKDFNLTRYDINLFTSDEMTLEKQSYYLKDIGEVPVKIIKANKLYYKAHYKDNIAKIEYKPSNNITVTITNKSKFVQIQTAKYKGKELECLNFSFNQEFDYQSQDNSTQNQKINSKGFGLYGENIGLFYMEFIEFGDTVKYELKDIITIKDFKKINYNQ